MRARLLALALLAALPAPAQEPSAPPAATPDPRVEEMRRELDALRAQIDAATEKEETLVAALEQIEQEMSSRAAELADIQKQIEERRALSEQKREKMEDLERRIEGKRAWLKSRIRSTYIHGRPGYLKVLFAASSYADLVRRTKFNRIIARRDTELVAELEKDLKEIAQSRSDYEKDLALFESALNESRATNEELEIQRAFRQSLLDEVRTEHASYAGMKALLEKRAAQMSATIGSLGSAPLPGRNFESAKGALLAPLKKARLMRPFGEYTHPTGGRMMHQGIAYTCDIGEPVRAVFDGRVERAMWFSTYGQFVLIDHGDGWRSIYAHNSKLLKATGDLVREGEVIALTGDTGSLEGPFLFFGLYHKNQPVDPAEWFVK